MSRLPAKINPRGRARARQGGGSLLRAILRIRVGLSCKPSRMPTLAAPRRAGSDLTPVPMFSHIHIDDDFATGQPDMAMFACLLAKTETVLRDNLKNRLKNRLAEFAVPIKRCKWGVKSQIVEGISCIKVRGCLYQSPHRLVSKSAGACIKVRISQGRTVLKVRRTPFVAGNIGGRVNHGTAMFSERAE